MRKNNDKRARRVNRLQNLTIVLLTASALFLAANLPLFGALSDRSLIDLARDRNRAESGAAGTENAQAAALAFPVRMVYTNDFARTGEDAITTVSDGFERAGLLLGEALGSAYGAERITERAFLDALEREGLYVDFTAALPLDVLSGLLGVSAPELELEDVRRMLLSLAQDEALLYVQDGAGQNCRFRTAVSSAALIDFLAARTGESADFAFMLGDAYARLSPYTLVLSAPAARGSLAASSVLGGNEDAILRRAEFNSHTENRFTESSGTVIVREASSALYLHPDGTVGYQGGAVSADSLYYVKSEGSDPTLAEATAAAQRLVVTLTQDLLGDAALYLSGATQADGCVEVMFDLMVDGTPLRFADGSHAATVTVAGRCVTEFTLKARCYTHAGEETLLLPFAQAAAIARLWDGAELIVAYIDSGADTVQPAWIAE